MTFRGERFELDLDSEEDVAAQAPRLSSLPNTTSLDLNFIKDIAERAPLATSVPTPPKLKSSGTGFPAHKKRTKPSRFRQQHGRAEPTLPKSSISRSGMDTAISTDITSSLDEDDIEARERRKIDEENKQRLAQMSPEEIEQQRKELMSGLSSSLIERLLKRANIDEGRTDIKEDLNNNWKLERSLEVVAENHAASKQVQKELERTYSTNSTLSQKQPSVNQGLKKVSFEIPSGDDASNPTIVPDPDASPTLPPSDLHLATSSASLPPPTNIHFPKPSPAPSLDPSSPSFLKDLHSKYFPNLPSDPTKLAWMTPTDPSASPYNPSHTSLPPSSLRFDFAGALIPPRLALQIPATAGLHHHGLAPESAGYAIPELAILARSSVPAQRCVAYQTLGRILFRLGNGTFGAEGNDGEELCQGLWRCVEEGKVLDVLIAEAGKKEGTGHASARACAVEAVWLWRKGGGKKLPTR